MTDSYSPDVEPEDHEAEDYGHDAPGYEELQALLEKIFNSGDIAADGINATFIEGELGEDYDYDYEASQAALGDFFEQYGVPEEHAQPVYDAMEAHDGGYGAEALAEGLTANWTEINNDVDQSVHTGDYGWVETHNEANTATASAEGAIAVGDDLHGDVQTQTGDGVQVGEADNIQTGDGNVAGSDGAYRIGNEQVSADYGSINDSEFGEGDNFADDNYNSQNQLDTDIKDSFTNDYESTDTYTASDDDYVDVEVDVDAGYPAYEVVEEVHEYAPEVDDYDDDHGDPIELLD